MKDILKFLTLVSMLLTISIYAEARSLNNIKRAPAAAKSLSEINFQGFTPQEESNIFSDLYFLSTVKGPAKTLIPFKTKFANLLGDTLDGEAIVQLFLSKVEFIQKNNSLCGNGGACAHLGGDTIYLPQSFFEFEGEAGRALRLRMLLHEFYHIIDVHSAHFTCEQSQNGQCDQGIESAHGFSAVVLYNIAKFCYSEYCNNDIILHIGLEARRGAGYITEEGSLIHATAEYCPANFVSDPRSFAITGCKEIKKKK